MHIPFHLDLTVTSGEHEVGP